MRETGRSLAEFVNLAVRSSPFGVSAELAIVAVLALGAPVQAYAASLIVEGIATGADAWPGLVLLLVAVVATVGGGVGRDSVQMVVQEKIEGRLRAELLDVTTGMPGIEHYEDPAVADQISVVKENSRQVKYSTGSLAGVVAVSVSTSAVLVLLVSVHPILVVLPVVGLLRVWSSGHAGRIFIDALQRTEQNNRRYQRLVDIIQSSSAALEVRAFGMEQSMLRRIDEELERQNRVCDTNVGDLSLPWWFDSLVVLMTTR